MKSLKELKLADSIQSSGKIIKHELNILAFLEQVFPTPESRPDYICIDKACLVLRSAIRNQSWDRIWKHTTRFIVDTYHYSNHRTTDELCCKYCNPTPSDGS